MSFVANWSALLRLFIPLVLLALALWLRPRLGELDRELLMQLGYLPWLLTAVTAILAWQFNQLRFLLLATITAISYSVVQLRLQAPLDNPDAYAAFTGLSYALPITLTALLVLPERGILNFYGLTTVAMVLGLGLFFGGFAPYFLEWFPEHTEWLALRPVESLILSWTATALFILAVCVGLGALLWRDAGSEAAILASLTATFLVLGLLHLDHISMTMFIAAGCGQLFSIIRSSHAMAYRDDLTGLLARRALNERLKGLGRNYCLAMLDVDHFKKFNDTYGHDVGDEALRLVASRISRVGGGGVAFRYGGEEFCVVFPRKTIEQCIEPLEQVREAVGEYRMSLRNKSQRPMHKRDGTRNRGRMATRHPPNSVAVTISLGLAERNEEADSPEEVLKAADGQLYRAKRSGRNRLKY